MHKTWVEVSISALRHNARVLKAHAQPAAFMAVVKANAYGHGLVGVAKAVKAEAAWFGVDDVDEALALRRAGIQKPILILGYTRLNRLRDCARQSISFVAYNSETLRALSGIRAARGSFRIHIPIETGTMRQGLSGADLAAFVRQARRIPAVCIEGIHTHFANIEDTTNPEYAMKQLRAYERALGEVARLGVKNVTRHTAASAGAILYPRTRFDVARFGIALYGHWPSKETKVSASFRSSELELQPSLTWKTVVAQVKRAPRGTPIGYGLTERVARASVIAVLPVGYWEGFPRSLSSVGHVLIHGRRCKVLGRVCMNMAMVDVTDVPRVKPEDEVVLIGRQGREVITAEEIAAHAGTIQYEFLTRINPEIERRHIA